MSIIRKPLDEKDAEALLLRVKEHPGSSHLITRLQQRARSRQKPLESKVIDLDEGSHLDAEAKDGFSLESKSPEMPTVFLVSVSAAAWLNQRKSGDLDYAVSLQKIIETEARHKVVFIGKARSAAEILQKLKASSPPGILHLLINPHSQQNCLPLLTPEDLKDFKKQGIKIVVTAVEYAKHSCSPEGSKDQDKILDYLQLADEIIFLDENDKNSAIQINAAKPKLKLKEKLQNAWVIAVPCTVPVAKKPLKDREKNIISFGIIRRGKGISHLIKLAALIRDTQEKEFKNTKVLIVGSAMRSRNPLDDSALEKVLIAMYPDKKAEIRQQKDLVVYYHEKLKSQDPVLPIELHLDVPAKDLPALFDRCTYSFLPAYRGATLRNTSISSSLVNHFITYTHVTETTPTCLRSGGKHRRAMAIIPSKDTDYKKYADAVFQDILKREKQPALNEATENEIVGLVKAELSDAKIANEHRSAYVSLMKMAAPKLEAKAPPPKPKANTPEIVSQPAPAKNAPLDQEKWKKWGLLALSAVLFTVGCLLLFTPFFPFLGGALIYLAYGSFAIATGATVKLLFSFSKDGPPPDDESAPYEQTTTTCCWYKRWGVTSRPPAPKKEKKPPPPSAKTIIPYPAPEISKKPSTHPKK